MYKILYVKKNIKLIFNFVGAHHIKVNEIYNYLHNF